MKRMNRGQRAGLGAALGLGAAVAAVPAAQAADYTVTNLSDSGSGSLRAAIDDTNTNAGDDRILFQSGLSGTIAVAGDLPALTGPVEIVGPGKDQMKVDGDQTHALLVSESNLKVSGLTLANGRYDAGGGNISVSLADLTVDDSRIEGGFSQDHGGGGISLVGGALTISNSEISGNVTQSSGGGGVNGYYTTKVAISNSTFSGNAGAIGGGARLTLGSDTTIKDSVFENNQGATGAGLYATNGSIAVDSTLFSGNTATTSVGGALVGSLTFAAGGFAQGPYSVTNSTFTGNKADRGGAFMTVGGAKVQSSTITGNQSTGSDGSSFLRGAGMIAAFGQVTLDNSIVSGNTPKDITTTEPATNPVPVPGGSVLGSFNLVGNIFNTNITESVPGSNISSTDPGLGPLADNGGPTMTMMPADSSPVVNKGSSPLAVDQRGLTRPVDFNSIPFSSAPGANGADIGAVELQGGPLSPPSNEFSFGKVKLNRKKGVATLQVKVPGAGEVALAGTKAVKGSKKSSKAASTIGLTVKAKGKAAKTLKKKGKVKVKASVKFTPTGGTAKARSKTVKLVKKKKKKRK